MKSQRTSMIVVVVVLAALAFPAVGRADDKGKEKDKVAAVQDATVQFAMPQPQPPPAGVPGTPDNSSTHFLLPDDVTIRKGGTVTFVVNGGGHGIAIHEVNKKTTRDDIAENLCQGGANEADRRGRNAVCNALKVTELVNVNGVSTNITGTENLNYTIDDAKGAVVILTGFNLTATNSAPPTIIANPRVDDTAHSHRLLATSGRAPGDTGVAPTGNPPAIANNPAGAFLAGTAFNPAATPPVATPGNRIQVQFNRNGRFLVICMNRSHALNDHMFGFVSVVGGDDDDK
jgi:plastocyanin